MEQLTLHSTLKSPRKIRMKFTETCQDCKTKNNVRRQKDKQDFNSRYALFDLSKLTIIRRESPRPQSRRTMQYMLIAGKERSGEWDTKLNMIIII